MGPPQPGTLLTRPCSGYVGWASCLTPPTHRPAAPASAQAVSRAPSHLMGACSLPAAGRQCQGRPAPVLLPGPQAAVLTFLVCCPVLGLCTPWASVPSQGPGAGRPWPGHRYLSETVLQVLKWGASHGAPCERPALRLQVARAQSLGDPGALQHCSPERGPPVLAACVEAGPVGWDEGDRPQAQGWDPSGRPCEGCHRLASPVAWP